MPALFTVLGVGLLAVAFVAARQPVWPVAIGAAAIGGWLLMTALQSIRRR